MASAAHTVDVLSGDVVTVVARYTSIAAANGYAYIWIKSTGTFNLTTTSNSVMSRYLSGYTEGTGSIGGWEKSEMRKYLVETIKPLIPDPVLSAIKAITKTHMAYNTDKSSYTQTTNDDVWIPDYNEMFNSTRPYKALFPDNASRKKYKVGATNASWWWLRSAYDINLFSVVNNGDSSYSGANSSGAVAIGFCT